MVGVTDLPLCSYNPTKRVGGYVMKRQDGKEQWIVRWAVLCTDKLAYYEDREDSEPRKDVRLLDCVDVEAALHAQCRL